MNVAILASVMPLLSMVLQILFLPVCDMLQRFVMALRNGSALPRAGLI